MQLTMENVSKGLVVPASTLRGTFLKTAICTLTPFRSVEFQTVFHVGRGRISGIDCHDCLGSSSGIA